MIDRDLQERCAAFVEQEAKKWADQCAPITADLLKTVASEIRALDLPLTSAREVTVTDEMVDRALVNFYGDNFIPSEIAPELIAMHRRDMRDAIHAALASAPQPACVGVEARGAKLRSIISMINRAVGETAGDNTPCGTRGFLRDIRRLAVEASALSPAPSPQAGGEDGPTTAELVECFRDTSYLQPLIRGWAFEHSDGIAKAIRAWQFWRRDRALSARREG